MAMTVDSTKPVYCMPYVVQCVVKITDGKFSKLYDTHLDEAEDVLIGYVAIDLLKVPFSMSHLFNSHWHKEDILNMKLEDIPYQVSMGYSLKENIRVNLTERTPGVKVAFSLQEDPSRFLTIHCYLFSQTEYCQEHSVP